MTTTPITANDPNDLLALRRVSKILDVSMTSTYRLIASGRLKAYDISDAATPKPTYRVRRGDVEALLRPVESSQVA